MRPVRFVLIFCLVLLTASSVTAQTDRDRTVEREIPGELRPDGFSTLGTVVRYRLGGDEFLSNTVIVKTRRYLTLGKGATRFGLPEIDDILKSYDVRGIRAPFPEFRSVEPLHADRFGLGRIYEVTFGAHASVLDLCDRLMGSPEVEYAEPSLVRHALAVPNDPKYSQQYALAKVHAAEAWDVTTGDTSVTIAIVDGGTDWEHEDLRGNIRVNYREIPGNEIDDDHNGKVDDVHGWDFVGNVSADEAAVGVFRDDNNPKIDSNMAPDDLRHHGTHVAGVAGASTNNDIGIAGLGYRCKILPVKITSDSSAELYYRSFEGILYAAISGARVINCSWGGTAYSQAEQDVVDQVTGMGVLIVAASGNDGRNTDRVRFYPADYRNVVSVGATTSTDHAATFSNYGVLTSVWAPGASILSTISGENRYASSGWSGTSMAAPLVSGLAALIVSHHPDWSPIEIARQMRSTADDVVADDSSARPEYYGRINAQRALEANDDWNGENAVPGIAIVDRSIDVGGGIIRDYDLRQLRLTFQNHLGTGRNVRVTVRPLSEELRIVYDPIVIDSLGHLDQGTITVGVGIDRHTPWYQGTADLLVTYESGTYRDYELVGVPYRVTSTTVYTRVQLGVPPETHFRSSYSPLPESVWSSVDLFEAGSGYLRFDDLGSASDHLSDDPFPCIHALDRNRAFTASGVDIFRTVDGGAEWSRDSSLRTLVGDVSSIHFFSATEGIAVGQPLGSRLGLVRTTDGGKSWHLIPDPPDASDADRFFTRTAFWLGDDGWVAMEKGRIYHTTDKGASWESSTLDGDVRVSDIAFTTPDDGVLIYRITDASGTIYRVASTRDGGRTWTMEVYDLGRLSIVPVHLSAPVGTSALVVVGSDGRVAVSRSNGENWSYAASSNAHDTVETASTVVVSATTFRVWMLGTSIARLDVDLDALSAVPEDVPDIADRTTIYPNPASESAVIAYRLTERTHVVVEMLDGRGKRMGLLVDREESAGEHSVHADLSGYPSGVYFCRLRMGGEQVVREVGVVR